MKKVSLLVLLALFSMSASVWSQTPTTVCSGTDTTTYSPGLRLFVRTTDVAWTDDYPDCVSSTPGIDSASSPGGGYTTETSCLNLVSNDPVDGSQRIDWSNDEYSIFSWDAEDVIIVGSVVTVNATVTEGLFLGQPLIKILVIPAPNLTTCLTEPGFTESSGPLTLMVLPL